MAEFKMNVGDSSRIDMTATPFHEGWGYLTTDDKQLYFDVKVGTEQRRIHITAPAPDLIDGGTF